MTQGSHPTGAGVPTNQEFVMVKILSLLGLGAVALAFAGQSVPSKVAADGGGCCGAECACVDCQCDKSCQDGGPCCCSVSLVSEDVGPCCCGAECACEDCQCDKSCEAGGECCCEASACCSDGGCCGEGDTCPRPDAI
jgi:hypothetical protein